MKSRSQEEASTGKSIVTTQTEPNPKPGNPQQEHPENQQASIGFQTVVEKSIKTKRIENTSSISLNSKQQTTSSEDIAPFVVANWRENVDNLSAHKSSIFRLQSGKNVIKENVRYLLPHEYVEHELGKARKPPTTTLRRKPTTRLRFDFMHFCSCTFFKHILILIFEVIYLCYYFLTDICEVQKKGERCLAADLFTLNSLVSVISLVLINFLYFLRLIEKFAQKLWLHIELHLYVTMAVLHLLGGFGLFVHGIRFWALAMFALAVSGQFALLCAIRIMMIKLKVPAQDSLHDPDGNLDRARDPNAKFVHRGRLMAMWTS